MPRLLIVYDPMDRICVMPSEFNTTRPENERMKEALLHLPDGLEGKDIYAIAQKLSELLLEQL